MTLVSSRSLPYSRQSSHHGFSIVEVIITMAIVTILTALVMVRYGSFNSAVLLKNQAYEIALTIREAQISAISVRGDNDATTQFRGAYGVYFDSRPATNQEFLVWRDNLTTPLGGDKLYNASEDTVIATYAIDNRFVIAGICNSEGDCTNDNRNASVAFVRPNFDAVICFNYGTCDADTDAEPLIVLQLETDDAEAVSRQVIVRQTGQISVENN